MIRLEKGKVIIKDEELNTNWLDYLVNDSKERTAKEVFEAFKQEGVEVVFGHRIDEDTVFNIDPDTNWPVLKIELECCNLYGIPILDIFDYIKGANPESDMSRITKISNCRTEPLFEKHLDLLISSKHTHDLDFEYFGNDEKTIIVKEIAEKNRKVLFDKISYDKTVGNIYGCEKNEFDDIVFVYSAKEHTRHLSITQDDLRQTLLELCKENQSFYNKEIDAVRIDIGEKSIEICQSENIKDKLSVLVFDRDVYSLGFDIENKEGYFNSLTKNAELLEYRPEAVELSFTPEDLVPSVLCFRVVYFGVNSEDGFKCDNVDFSNSEIFSDLDDIGFYTKNSFLQNSVLSADKSGFFEEKQELKQEQKKKSRKSNRP
ncbi:hypothetical protein [Vibrio parahaemolyticus]|uniref:hypothetical protein n=1 Tax=Vibrio parahaemolyticus TaxID=670 RepID=UPI00215BB324|nr:hypothetical protein [Vibrio parahaemolyticus]MCR9667692.1 hypothetical protein [Vibrio parahaemolyticus]MCR9827033.1 hypothetical protein [Vibrio parahaemolyticus]